MGPGDLIEYDTTDGRFLLAYIDEEFPFEFEISFLDPLVFPQVMRVPKARCKKWNTFNDKVRNDICECGLKGQNVSSRAHFRYCPKFKP